MAEQMYFEKIAKILKEELSAFCERVKQNHIGAGQVASGKTLKSIGFFVKNEGGLPVGIAYSRKAFHTLELGRYPAPTPRGFVGIILQWMKDKGISASPITYKRLPSERWQPKYTPEQRGQMSLAGAIAHTIRTKGTRLYRKGGRSDIYSNEVERTLNNARDRIIKVFDLEIDTIQINYIKN